MSEEGINQEEVDVLGTAMQLAQLLKEDPQGIDKAEFKRGEILLTFFQDPNFGPSFPNLRDFKTEIVVQAIEDMANRSKILSKSFMGVAFANNALETFNCEYGQSPKGNVVYKIGLRDVVAFQNWRSGQNSEISAEDINASIYRLTVEWSKLL